MATLQAVWQQVQSKKDGHGVDGMSVAHFALKQEHYLLELQQALKEGSYQPLPVKGGRLSLIQSIRIDRPLTQRTDEWVLFST